MNNEKQHWFVLLFYNSYCFTRLIASLQEPVQTKQQLSYFALVQREWRRFARSDQITVVPLDLQPVYLPSFNPLGLTHHPSFCHYLISPATLSTSGPLPRFSFHLSSSAVCSPPAPRFPFASVATPKSLSCPPLPSFSDPAHLTITLLPFRLNCPLYSSK